MITGYPEPTTPRPTRPLEQPSAPRPPSAAFRSSCFYRSPRRSRRVFAAAVLASAVLHAGVFFGTGHSKKKSIPPKEEPSTIIALTFADVKELDEPEPVTTDEPGEKPDPGELVPMQADLIQVPQPTDFVQQFDYASLVERPDLSQAKVITIPEHIGRGGKIGEGIGAIFNLADLDRAPVVVFQIAPVVPTALKQDGISATVRVGFIVNVEGRVINAYTVESTDHRFDDAAVSGVSKWKFKPGMKGGRKVNTRMAVPIVLKVSEHD